MANTSWRMEYGYNGIKDNPCKQDCPDRSGECRLTCKKFAEYYEKRKIEEAERNKKRDAAIDFNNYKFTVVNRARKHKHL